MKIFCRDFLNQHASGRWCCPPGHACIGGSPVPRGDTFTGYGGVGGYAAFNGDPWSGVTVGHKISQGAFTPLPANITDTGESFGLLVVGGRVAKSRMTFLSIFN